jgi:hypothetical protein
MAGPPRRPERSSAPVARPAHWEGALLENEIGDEERPVHLVRGIPGPNKDRHFQAKALCGLEGKFHTNLGLDDGPKQQCRGCWSRIPVV